MIKFLVYKLPRICALVLCIITVELFLLNSFAFGTVTETDNKTALLIKNNEINEESSIQLEDKNASDLKENTLSDLQTQLKKLKEYEIIFQQKAEQIAEWPKWIYPAHSLRLGDNDPIIAIIRKQLAHHGYAVTADKKNENNFDSELKKAIESFQTDNFLESDGIIGYKTWKALNLSFEKRLQKIKLNIARWGKLLPQLIDRMVLVNIPTYDLYALENTNIDLKQPIVVGLKDRATPVFTTLMTSIVLNPAWGVPVTIFLKDKLRRVRLDPEYLSKNGYIVMDKEGQILTHAELNWAHVSKSYFPYRVRQLPGTMNALGPLKFNLDNSQAIYMHGTPQMQHFQKRARAFSSGCIRVKEPLKLACWILKDTQYKDAEVLEEKIKTLATSSLILKKKIAVLFSYISVWVDENNKILFSDDPYDKDEVDIKKDL